MQRLRNEPAGGWGATRQAEQRVVSATNAQDHYTLDKPLALQVYKRGRYVCLDDLDAATERYYAEFLTPRQGINGRYYYDLSELAEDYR